MLYLANKNNHHLQFIKTLAYIAVMATVSACGGSSTDKTTVVLEPLPQPTPVPSAEHSVARAWNEVSLHAIRNDYARPTVHARNLFHLSSAMFDAWSVFDDNSQTFLYGNNVANFSCDEVTTSITGDTLTAQEQAISFAAYRLIEHRFRLSPGQVSIMAQANELMAEKGYDINDTATDNGSATALGNHIAQCYINFGLQDGANERQFYANKYYQPVNPALVLSNELSGNPEILDLNRWQPLAIEGYLDQAGNPVDEVPSFLSPEWGNVVPFSLTDNDKQSFTRNGDDYQVYHDPGVPPLLGGEQSAQYQWGFALVSIWSAHLAVNDEVMWDISPASLGNIGAFPSSFTQYNEFYKQLEGGDASSGYSVNPSTGQPYEQQLVPRGDYARVLAEFWADGPDSETPPGHWFVILNSVNDHPKLERKWQGQGETLSKLEWDIKSYFALGGTMHDAAIAAWSIKGFYDYIRPVSAIRAMAALGQSSDESLDSYHQHGLPLVPNYIELVNSTDPLAGENLEHVGKIKVYAWKGPSFIENPETDVAGVDWILAENWWPYQRPSFVTPPFAGYVSGHSTYSRAAAELLTSMTGSAYFPGGMSEFVVQANNFLVFEQGPSVDMVLQWATYRDASDQCSLSRIWGGIHPPADDIPGRLIGEKIGQSSFEHAQQYFNK